MKGKVMGKFVYHFAQKVCAFLFAFILVCVDLGYGQTPPPPIHYLPGTIETNAIRVFNASLNTCIAADGSGYISCGAGNKVFYADQYASGSTTCGIAEAGAAAQALTLGGVVQLPLGSCNVFSTITLLPGVTYRGYGSGGNANGLNNCGTILVDYVNPLFNISSTNNNELDVNSFCAWSHTGGGGDIFNLNGGSTEQLKIHDFAVTIDNAGSSFVDSTTATNTFAENQIWNGTIIYSVGQTVPAINVISNALSACTFSNIVFLDPASVSTTAPSIYLKENQAAARSGNCVLRDLVFEPPQTASFNYAGAIQAVNVGPFEIQNIFVDDLVYTPTAPTISITPYSTLVNGTTAPITILDSMANRGTSTFPDLFVAQTTPSQITLIGDNFLWVGGATGQPFTYINLNNTIQNQHDANAVNIPLSYAISWTPVAATVSTCTAQTITVTGLASGGRLSVNPPASMGTHLWIGSIYASAANTASVSFCADATGGTPPSGTWTFTQ